VKKYVRKIKQTHDLSGTSFDFYDTSLFEARLVKPRFLRKGFIGFIF